MSAIKIKDRVIAADIPFTMTVEKAGEATSCGPLWVCAWTKPDGRVCRRSFLESNLTPAPTKTRGGK